jgi:hypothetical protein
MQSRTPAGVIAGLASYIIINGTNLALDLAGEWLRGFAVWLRRRGLLRRAAAAEMSRHGSATSMIGGAYPDYTYHPKHMPEAAFSGTAGWAAVPVGYTWSHLSCRIGHCVPVWRPLTRVLSSLSSSINKRLNRCA